ncbi:MAG: septal ring lytic transglycosylase RlpA family protein [Nitrospirae bacterium]|nr:septal ring lytic transglycosylase RlpA family protein [Nitrospirota bacterium]MBI3353232.1 septal ring lytic transglycosylase RlpA family protein [Nitrospirota bacterium]
MKRFSTLIFLNVIFFYGCFSSHPIRISNEPSRCVEPEAAEKLKYPISQSPENTKWCKGIASWYGRDFHGRKTSSGEVYNMYGLSAAHRTLPLGTFLKVISVENEKSVIVKVNDRGPFVAGRILDLSFGAASVLGMAQKGTAEVMFGVVQTPATETKSFFTVQAGAFSIKENAVFFQQKLVRQYRQTVRLIPFEGLSGMVYRVRLGVYQKEDEAEKAASLLQKENGIIPFVLKEEQIH